MTLTLYTAPTGNGRKPLVFLKLLNIPHELHLFSWPTKDIKQDWYLKLNPQGLVPTLVDGELILPESNAILQYLAETYDKQGKFSYNLQTDRLEYWQQQKWLFYQATQFAGTLFRFNTYIGIKADDGKVWDNILQSFADAYKVIDETLAQSEWFVGDKFTIVDIAFGVGNHRRIEVVARLGLDKHFQDYDTKYPHVAQWYKKFLEVEGVKEALALK